MEGYRLVRSLPKNGTMIRAFSLSKWQIYWIILDYVCRHRLLPRRYLRIVKVTYHLNLKYMERQSNKFSSNYTYMYVNPVNPSKDIGYFFCRFFWARSCAYLVFDGQFSLRIPIKSIPLLINWISNRKGYNLIINSDS